MIPINLERPKVMRWQLLFKVLGISQQYTMPQEWNELTEKQLIGVADLIFKAGNAYRKKLLLVQRLTNMPMVAFNWISDENKLFLAEQVEWIFDYTSITLTKQLLPYYGGFYGPADKFRSITVGEFIFADSYFVKYNETQDVSLLDRLIAVLYRRKKKHLNVAAPDFDGDVREIFNNSTMDLRLEAVSEWPLAVKHAVFLWYMGCRNDLVSRYDMIFSVEETSEEQPVKKSSTIYPWVTQFAFKWGSVEDAMRVKVHSFLTDVQVNLELARKKK